MRVRISLIAIAIPIAMAGAPAGAAALITIDKSAQQMKVEVDGDLRWIWPVSTGQLRYDTPSGRYTAFRMEADHFSKEWDDAPMPHSIFFSQKGHAIHGYLNTRNIGSPASHGCVRLEPDNAARLYALVEEQGLPNTKVVITGDVRVALGQRGLPRGREADTTVATREPFGVRSQAHQPPYYDHQSPAGYPAPSGYPALSYDRVAPAYPYDAPRLPADGSYRSYPYRY